MDNEGKIVVKFDETPGLKMLVDAYKSLISDYALRTKQSEELTTVLLAEKLTSEDRLVLIQQVFATHLKDRANERAVHQQQVLQTTSLAINNVVHLMSNNSDIENIRSAVNIIAKGLTIALGNMHNFEAPRSDIDTTDSQAVNQPMENS